MAQHHYQIQLEWTGNRGSGTLDYRAYGREHEITGIDKLLAIPGTSDPKFRGDKKRYNPEELLLASLSACHMLWYLHLCAVNGIIVMDYRDEAEGIMEELGNGAGHFSAVTLKPVVSLSNVDMIAQAEALHEEANRMCFIANSVKFPVSHQVKIEVQA
ncbi:MAG: OsmC family protein [Bacteroidota bacterium]